MMKHLSDEEIQQYLEGLPGVKDSFRTGHLEECPECRRNLAAYRMLFRELEKGEEIALSGDFSERVMKKISGHGSALKPRFNFLNILLAAVFLIVMVVVTGQYISWGDLGQSTLHYLTPSISLHPEQIVEIEKPTVEAVEKYKIYIFFGLVLAFAFVMDQLVLSRHLFKRKAVLFLFNGL